MKGIMFGYYAQAIYVHKETTVMVSNWVSIVRNIEGKLGRICPHMFLFP